MGTVLDLITASLLDLGVIASGEAPTADEAADALRALNLLLESWRLESLMVYAVDTVTFTTTGATSYSWGPGGDINGVRPVHLGQAVLRFSASPNVDYPLRVLTDEEYHSIQLKSLSTPLAYTIYLDRQFPLANLYLWPVQAAGTTILLYPWHPLSGYSALTTSVALPPGYERALQKNLAIELAPQYRDCQITDALAVQALQAKTWVKVANHKSRYADMPGGIPTGRGRSGRGTDRAAFYAGYST